MQEVQETLVQSLGREDPRSRKWQPTPVFLPGESQGRGSLVGTESDTTEATLLQQQFSNYFIKCLLCAKHYVRQKLGVFLGTLRILPHFSLMTVL